MRSEVEAAPLNLGFEIINLAVRDLRHPTSCRVYGTARRFLFPRKPEGVAHLEAMISLMGPGVDPLKVLDNIEALRHIPAPSKVSKPAYVPMERGLKPCQFCGREDWNSAYERALHRNNCKRYARRGSWEPLKRGPKKIRPDMVQHQFQPKKRFCGGCGYSFIGRDMEAHIQTHTAEIGHGNRKPCVECGEPLTSSMMRRHVCGQFDGFAQASPYKFLTCAACGIRARKRNLRAHIKIHSKGRGIKVQSACIFCHDSVFTTAILSHHCEEMKHAEAGATDAERHSRILSAEENTGVPHEHRGGQDCG